MYLLEAMLHSFFIFRFFNRPEKFWDLVVDGQDRNFFSTIFGPSAGIGRTLEWPLLRSKVLLIELLHLRILIAKLLGLLPNLGILGGLSP